MFLWQEETESKAALWPQRQVVLRMKLLSTWFVKTSAECLLGYVLFLVTFISTFQNNKKEDRGNNRLVRFTPVQENYDTNPPGSYFQTYKEWESSSKKTTWISQTQIILDQPGCLLWWDGWLCGPGESSRHWMLVKQDFWHCLPSILVARLGRCGLNEWVIRMTSC